MRNRLASRAHSFKENLLGAFGHHNASSEAQSPSSLIHESEDHGKLEGHSSGHPSSTTSKKGQNNSNSSKGKNSSNGHPSHNIRTLSKKTNSSDNLIEYSAPKCTDTLVREVQLALRYFEDAVAKETYEMLPGCATVVLETVVAMQSFAVSKASQALQAVLAKENEGSNNGMTLKPPSAFENQGSHRQNQDRFGIFKAMENVYSCVARLTQWADRLIVEGNIDKEDDYINKVIEPLRKSVVVLANAISSSEELSRKPTAGLRRSLPDVLAVEEYTLENKNKTCEETQTKKKPPSPPPKPRINIYTKHAPPLPPKGALTKGTVSFSEDEIDNSDPFSADNVGSEGAKHLDWFSNPLFGQENIDHSNKNKIDKSHAERKDKKRTKKKNAPDHIQISNDTEAAYKDENNLMLSVVDVPDFCRPQRNSLCGADFILNSSDDQQSAGFDQVKSFDDALRNTTSPRPLAASSPKPTHVRSGNVKSHYPLTSLNPSSLAPRHRDSSSSSGGDIPPALPRKGNVQHVPSLSVQQPEIKNNVRRKISQYDNVFASPPPAMFLSPPPAIKSQNIRSTHQNSSYLKPLEATASLFPNFRPEFDNTSQDKCYTNQIPTSGFLTPVPSSNTLTVQQHSPLRASSSEPPPPLPPKKRNIMSYMEMFGQSVLPTDTHFLQGVAQTQDLLQAVWHQNYNGFSDYIHEETSLNPHILHPSSSFHHLTDSTVNKTNSLWNYHQKLMQDSLHTFGIPQHRKPIMPTERKHVIEEKYGASDRLDMYGRQQYVSPSLNFETIGFPALLPEQNIPPSRMPPPFPHSFDDDDNDEFEEGDELGPAHISGSPPALPPKRNMRKPAPFLNTIQQSHSSGGGDRFIPIVKEADGSIIVCNRADQDNSSQSQAIILSQHRSKVEKIPESIPNLSEGISEAEGNDQSAGSSSASCTTSTSGLGTSTHGDHSCVTSDGTVPQNRKTKSNHPANSIKHKYNDNSESVLPNTVQREKHNTAREESLIMAKDASRKSYSQPKQISHPSSQNNRITNEKRNISEDTTTTTTSEDLEDNCEGSYFSSRHGLRKTIANPGKGAHHNTSPASGHTETASSLEAVQNNVTTSNTRRKEHSTHHHHHHHHHHHGTHQKSLKRNKKRNTNSMSSDVTGGMGGSSLSNGKGIEKSVLDQLEVAKSSSKLFLYNADDTKSETSSTTTNATRESQVSSTSQKSNRESTSRNNGLLRAGRIDALIVLATQSYKNDFLYQEAFLCTYRTFVSTHDLLEKLVHRFRRFSSSSKNKPFLKSIPTPRAIDTSDDEESAQALQHQYQRVARSSFSLLVRVVDGLVDCDFEDTCVMELLTDFMAELVADGELILARALRSKFIQKFEQRKARLLPELDTSGLSLLSKPSSLLQFKSLDLAEQMTLLDSQLFIRLDSAELILWVQEQNEDKSPNLTKFTEHFNNMSYWCRTKILEQDESKDRERLVMKFIKIMKWLRKQNNFNSYLALLSALDSAPIRRLEWQRSITEGLKEYCALIDSSSSFRAYRHALSESTPPCIPYVGLVLQDLTFVHIGNSDNFDGKVNFAKRWQQFNILDNLRRFKKETYPFKRKDEIVNFFANFENYWTEDQMWSMSEKIKPRGKKSK